MKLKLNIVLAAFLGLLNLMTTSGQNNTKMESKKAELCFEIKSLLGEGAFWDHHEQRLYWVDIEGKKVHLFDPATKINSTFDTPSRIGTVVPKNKEAAVIALEDGIYMINTSSGEISLLSDVESKMGFNRFNDGKCDRSEERREGKEGRSGWSP